MDAPRDDLAQRGAFPKQNGDTIALPSYSAMPLGEAESDSESVVTSARPDFGSVVVYTKLFRSRVSLLHRHAKDVDGTVRIDRGKMAAVWTKDNRVHHAWRSPMSHFLPCLDVPDRDETAAVGCCNEGSVR